LVAIAAMALVSCGGSEEGDPGVRSGRLTGVYRLQGHPHELFFVVQTEGYCVGSERRPVLEGAEIEERPDAEAVVTASVRYFPKHGNQCMGIGLGVSGEVRTDTPVAELSVFDGSESPPRHLHVGYESQCEHRQKMRRLRDQANAASERR